MATAPARIFLAPAPRTVADILDASDLARLRALGELTIHEDGPVTDALFREQVLGSTIIIGQLDLPAERLARLPELKVIFNVEGNFLPNIDYAWCFSHGVRILNVSPVFAEPVAEVALAMAIDLGRGITRSDRRFRSNAELYGLAANRDAYTLFRSKVGFVGMGDLGRAILPLLAPFGCDILAYDPWLPADYLAGLGCRAATLDQVLRESRTVFVVAGVTSENQGFLGAGQFAAMQPGASLLLLSRAGVADFEALLDAAASGRIRVATDVFPEEPVAPGHRLRGIDNLLLSPHQAGAMDRALSQIGKLVVADAELIARGVAPVMCKVAQPESVSLFRSMPVAKS